MMTTDTLAVARELAEAHREADPGTTTIRYFPFPNLSEIHLLKVSTSAPTTWEVLPFRFNADKANGVPYPFVIILLSPEEWSEVQHGHLSLPDGWILNDAEDI